VDVYLANLAAEATEADLRKIFGLFGKVDGARIIQDRRTGQPTDSAVVEMQNDADALAAIAGLDEKTVKGQKISVSKRPLTKGKQ